MNTEAQRQAGVLQDLWGWPAAPEATPGWREHGEPLRAGRAAYQGNAGATAERVLAAAYPTVQALLGDEALALLARQLWHHHPPTQGDLTAWGQILPEWLADLPDMQDWPYVPDCARLDWARHTAEHAGDAPFEPGSLALLGTQDPADLRIELRPGLSVIRSDWPVVSLWQAHQTASTHDNLPPEADRLKTLRRALAARQAETAVVWRREWRAEVCELPKCMAGWMSALAPSAAQSSPLLSTLLASAPADFDLGQWLALALHQGWIWRVSVTDPAG
ncbi:putative DNA-binding domain-containing protein [Aquabacterium sp.]|uniref:HvfC/BufC family peptide modification chaperone n=1 Tax=Aquabacterium sp. TaxID=1872578 RepID=UPI0019A9D078|nr:putative DNA-binding domain-containing protein [Aquabacterium sp.]MBC7698934.1 putative DNA-binding domain-containing protein [Aquabacterium sp.]